MRASSESGGSALLQFSQVGRSSSTMSSPRSISPRRPVGYSISGTGAGNGIPHRAAWRHVEDLRMRPPVGVAHVGGPRFLALVLRFELFGQPLEPLGPRWLRLLDADLRRPATELAPQYDGDAAGEFPHEGEGHHVVEDEQRDRLVGRTDL